MKKIYALAAAAALTASAFAATPVQNNAKVAEKLPVNIEQLSTNAAKPAKAPAKVVSSRNDLLGTYKMNYTWPFDSNDRWGGSLVVNFEAGTTPTEIIIKNMPFSDVDCVAYFDASAQTLTINQQDAFVNNGVQEYWLMLGPDPAGGNTLVDTNKIWGDIDADGNIEFSVDFILLLGTKAEGYYCGFRHMTFTALHEFEPDFSTLVSIGDAEFTDNFMNNMYKPEYQVTTPVAVPAYKTADNKKIVLVNPYMCGAWEEMNPQTQIGKGPGYLEFDLSDHDVVLLSVLCNASLWFEDEDGLWSCYPYNSEARMVQLEGYDTEDVYMEYAAVGKPLSFYDDITRTIETHNGWFGMTGNPVASYGFVEEYEADGKTPKTWVDSGYTVVLPEGWEAIGGDPGNVAGIGADNNGATRYFNLQGMEVKAPVAGEVVIVKNGSKTSKVIF